MSRHTKRELEEQLDILEHENRRYRRAINQLCIDIDVNVDVDVSIERKVPPNERVKGVLARAEREWNMNVTEPGLGGNSDRITYYIKSTDCLGWTWEKDYVRNGQYAWCGAFASAAYGTDVLLSVRKNTFSSCYRMHRDWFASSRLHNSSQILPGDIVVVYTSDERSPSYGNHITIATSAPDKNGDFQTIEGNASGLGPNEDWREGVSKRTRHIDSVARVYRLIDEDYEQ